MKREELERLFSLPEGQLETEIGRGLSGALPLAAADRGEAIERARAWIGRNRLKICATLADSDRVNSLLADGPRADRLELAAASWDALATVFSVGLPILAVSVLIVRKGIRELCSEQFRPKRKPRRRQSRSGDG